MAGKRNGLGKGLDSLIPNKTVKEESASQQKVSKEKQEKNVGSGEILVKINEVEPNREQPRKEFDEDSLMELADSIRQFGILQPLLVQKKKDYYEIIAGERRWRAAKLAGRIACSTPDFPCSKYHFSPCSFAYSRIAFEFSADLISLFGVK